MKHTDLQQKYENNVSRLKFLIYYHTAVCLRRGLLASPDMWDVWPGDGRVFFMFHLKNPNVFPQIKVTGNLT